MKLKAYLKVNINDLKIRFGGLRAISVEIGRYIPAQLGNKAKKRL